MFLTSERTIRPGLIAFLLYQLRWDGEKVFDPLKNKLGERQAWATSRVAKAAQAQLIGWLHNLLLRVEERLEAEGIENHAEWARTAKELERAHAHAAKAGRKFPSPGLALQCPTQRSVKLLRWLPSASRRTGPASRTSLPGRPPRPVSPLFMPLSSLQSWTPFNASSARAPSNNRSQVW